MEQSPSPMLMCGLADSLWCTRKQGDPGFPFLNKFPWLLGVSHFLQGQVPLLC